MATLQKALVQIRELQDEELDMIGGLGICYQNVEHIEISYETVCWHPDPPGIPGCSVHETDREITYTHRIYSC